MSPSDWNPYQTSTWTLRQVQQWLDSSTNGWKFYDGLRWKIDAKNLGFGRYAVSFKKEKD